MRLLSHLRKWKRQSSWSISSCSCLLFMQLPFLHAAAFSSCSCPSLHAAGFSSCSCLLFMQLPFSSCSCPSLHAAGLLFMQLAFSSCSCPSLHARSWPSLHAAAFSSYSWPSHILSYPCKVPWSPDQFPTVNTQLAHRGHEHVTVHMLLPGMSYFLPDEQV